MDLSDWDDIQGTISHAVIAASAGDNTIVSAVSGKQIVVVFAAMYADDDALVRFESGTGGTALTGQMQLYAKSGTALQPGASTGAIEWDWNPGGWVITGVGALLNLEVSNGNIGGVLGYILQ